MHASTHTRFVSGSHTVQGALGSGVRITCGKQVSLSHSRGSRVENWQWIDIYTQNPLRLMGFLENFCRWKLVKNSLYNSLNCLFAQPTSKTHKFMMIQNRKTANPLIWEAATTECLAFLLEKHLLNLFNWLSQPFIRQIFILPHLIICVANRILSNSLSNVIKFSF